MKLPDSGVLLNIAATQTTHWLVLLVDQSLGLIIFTTGHARAIGNPAAAPGCLAIQQASK
ncbi:MAG: hypothetical protein ABJC10_10930 [Acidobacteriota bacterium]